MQRPSYLAEEEPYDALCHHFNVAPPQSIETSIPITFDMVVKHDGPLPTHVLAATIQISDAQPSFPNPPLMLPINANIYNHGFRELENLLGPATPVTHTGPSGSTIVTLPVIPIEVPHLSSLPLLLLFGMGLETKTDPLVWRLLPSQVIEEFPNAALMAQILARARQEQFDGIFKFNQGLWRNILALGMKDARTVELVQTAWNVTAETRKIRQRSLTTTRR